jgi:glycosyltransferase involved in cell wall biosynthesis
MRVAIVHYWLLKMRGGEKVVESLCRMLPDADIFTLFYDPSQVSSTIRERKVTTSFLNGMRKHYRSLLPLMPMALENFDLRGYDVVISSESGPAKGVLVPSATRHVCYCHSPMRYLWELYPAYLHDWTRSSLKRALMAPISSYLRMWDFASAARVDSFVANSENVRRRIWRTYRREAEVIYPPVAVEKFYYKQPDDYFLIISELVAYKRVDTAVKAFTAAGRPLRIVGTGPEYPSLRRIAGNNIEFCGWVPDEQLRELYSRCRALIFPGVEDFGIAAVEALASGKPVIAVREGGVIESVPAPEPLGGVFYCEADEAHLLRALDEFEKLEWRVQAADLQQYANRFRESEFHRRMQAILTACSSADKLSIKAHE